MPAVFAFADKVIEQPQVSLFAAFGSFAMLVLVEFEGSWRTRLAAYLALVLVGAAFVTLGTLCSRNAWLAAGSMAVVGFVTLFSGVISGYVAAAGTGALLLFVLPVTIVAPASAIPDRLEGWALAAGAGIFAQLLLWPPRRQAGLRHDAAVALRAVADLLDADRQQVAERAHLARTAVDALGRRMLGAPHRPTGPTAAAAALAALPDELDWLLSFAEPSAERPVLELVSPEDREALAAAAAALRAGATTLDGGDAQPDFARLDAARAAVAVALARRLARAARRRALDPGGARAALPDPGRDLLGARGDGLRPPGRRQRPGSVRPLRRSKRPSRRRSSTRACAQSGSGTASAAQPGSHSPSSSLSKRASSTASGSCSGRSRSCGRTRSAPAGRSSAR